MKITPTILCIVAIVAGMLGYLCGRHGRRPNFEPIPVADKDLYVVAIELIGTKDFIVQDNYIFIIPDKDKFSIQTYSLKGTALKLKIISKAEPVHEYDLMLQESEKKMKDDYMERLRMFGEPEPNFGERK